MLADFHPSVYPGLEAVPVPEGWADEDVPHDVEALIADAEESAWALEESCRDGKFVAGDYRYAWQVMRGLARDGTVPRDARFLEWGSGQGMTSVLASLLGWRATGVERNGTLVREARRMADRYGAERVRFVHGSYVEDGGGLPVVAAAGRDVVYVYPWPGEEPFFLRMFEAEADPGAVLLVATGPLEIHAFRKVDRG